MKSRSKDPRRAKQPRELPFSIGEDIEVLATAIVGLETFPQGQAFVDLQKNDGFTTPWEIRVPNLWPGERAKVRIEAYSQHTPLAFAKVIDRIVDHPQRTDPICTHHPEHSSGNGKCDGCPFMGLKLDAQREIKRTLISRQFGIELEVLHGDPPPALGYRMSAKRVAQMKDRKLILGSYRHRSHEIAAMSTCEVDHPQLNAAFAVTQAQLQKHNVVAYDESAQHGELRYIWGKTDGNRVHLTWIVTRTPSPELHAAMQDASRDFHPPMMISWQSHAGSGNAMRGVQAPTTACIGDGLPSLNILGANISLDALGFLQPNPRVAAQCYDALLLDTDAPTPCHGQLAFDLYAGAGHMTRTLRHSFDEVFACEAYPPMQADADVRAQRCEDFLKEYLEQDGRTPQLVIANPPRSGMSPHVCELLIRLGPARIHIMSCGPRGLKQNIDQLCAQGYTLQSLQGFDPLPHTSHIELVARLQKVHT